MTVQTSDLAQRAGCHWRNAFSLDDIALVIAYDGTGYGTDGSIWGGELLAVPSPDRFSRVGHLAVFALPGGDGAARQPARIALDLLHRAAVPWEFAPAPLAAVGDRGLHILAQQIPRGVGCVPTTSTTAFCHDTRSRASYDAFSTSVAGNSRMSTALLSVV